MLRKRSHRVTLAALRWAGLVALMLLISCQPQEVSLSFEIIERSDSAGTGEYYEDKDPRLVIIVKVAELDTLGNTVSSGAQAQLQALDFDRYFAVGVFQGWRPNLPSPSGVEVQSISQRGRTITIYARFYEPVEGTVQRDMVTSPYQLIKMWKGIEVKVALNAKSGIMSAYLA